MDAKWRGIPPREKLMKYGAAALSDSELLAIFLRTGMRGTHVMMLSQRLIQRFGSLHRLMNATRGDLMMAGGIGVAKYAQINAVSELARRSFTCQEALKNQAITSSQQMLDYLHGLLAHREREVFQVIFFDNQHRVIHTCEMFSGTINSVEVHPREIVREALQHNAAALILAHNHPSGVAKPSRADRDITQHIVRACTLMNIRVLDHIVIGRGEHVSFAEQGWM